jgi:hypothetical protein
MSMMNFAEEKTKALPVRKHQQGATQGRSLKPVSGRYTVTLGLWPERSSEVPLLRQ